MALTVVLRALGLGDLLTAVPALRAVRAARPNDVIVLAAPQWQRPLVDLFGAVDTVLDTDGLHHVAPVPWSGAPPALAINLHGRGPQSHRALLALQPERLVSFRCAGAGVNVGPAWSPDEHEVARWCRLVSSELGPADQGNLLLAEPNADALVHDAVIVHPGAAGVARRWPADRFAAVTKMLAGRGHRVVITGSPQERALALDVAREAGLSEDAVLAGRTSVLELAALMASARACISGDTGIAHLATAYARPSVVLFGPVSPAIWGPPVHPRHAAIWHGPSVGLRDGVDAALLDISVDEVVAAVDRVTAIDRKG